MFFHLFHNYSNEKLKTAAILVLIASRLDTFRLQLPVYPLRLKLEY